jgi:hypothetical protein
LQEGRIAESLVQTAMMDLKRALLTAITTRRLSAQKDSLRNIHLIRSIQTPLVLNILVRTIIKGMLEDRNK